MHTLQLLYDYCLLYKCYMNIFEFTCDSARHTNSVLIQKCACLFLSKFPPYLGIAISLYYHAASPFIFGLGNHFFSPVSVVFWEKSIMQVDTHGIMPNDHRKWEGHAFWIGGKYPWVGTDGTAGSLPSVRESMPTSFLAEVAIVVSQFSSLVSCDPCHC